MTNQTKGICLASAGALFWGASGVAAQYLFHVKQFTPDFLVFLRLLISGSILLAFDAFRNYGEIFSIWKQSYDRLQLLFFGIFGMLSVQYTYFVTIKYGNAATATILQYLAPIIIVLYFVAKNHRMPLRNDLAAVGIAICGTIALVTKGDFHSLAISDTVLFWGIISAFCGAFYTVQPKYLLHHFRSPLVIGWGMIIGAIILLPVNLPFSLQGIWDLQTLSALMFVIIFGTIIAFWSYLESIKYIRPTQTSTLGALEPLSAVFLSVFFLNIPFTVPEAVGAFFILGSAFLLNNGHK